MKLHKLLGRLQIFGWDGTFSEWQMGDSLEDGEIIDYFDVGLSVESELFKLYINHLGRWHRLGKLNNSPYKGTHIIEVEVTDRGS